MAEILAIFGLCCLLLTAYLIIWKGKGRTGENLSEMKKRLFMGQEELQRSNSRLNLILNSLPVVPFTCELQGKKKIKVTYIADSIKRVTGYTAAHFLADDTLWFSNIHPDDADRIKRQEHQLLKEGSLYLEYRWKNADGNYRWYCDNLQIIPSQNGHKTFVSGAWVDISERKEIEERIKVLNEGLERKVLDRTYELEVLNKKYLLEKKRAEDASQAKSHFLAMMGHEIRTPLNGIIGSISLIEQEKLLPKERGMLEIAMTSADALLSMLNNILDFSQIEAGEIHLSRAPFKLQSLFTRVMSMLSVQAKEKCIDLKLTAQFDEDIVVLGDRARIGQILSNLLVNAIKFTSKGEVHVKVTSKELTVRVDEERTMELVVEVEDTGIGIRKENFSRIFDMFVQADGTITREFGGAGLGLAICRRLVVLMDGKIGVRSGIGEGSTFWFSVELPIVSSVATDIGPMQKVVAIDRVRTLEGKILLVDDNRVNQKVVKMMLEKLGRQVDLAENGREAISMVEKNRYQLIFMDCEMPIMDGYEATRRIRGLDSSAEQGTQIPIIAVTANSFQEDRERCFREGMNDCLVKPFSKEQMASMLVKWATVNG